MFTFIGKAPGNLKLPAFLHYESKHNAGMSAIGKTFSVVSFTFGSFYLSLLSFFFQKSSGVIFM